MTSPFEDDEGEYLVLASASATDHVCLWPAWAGVPAGWSVCHGPADRPACLGWIETQLS
jgi:MbtH protein